MKCVCGHENDVHKDIDNKIYGLPGPIERGECELCSCIDFEEDRDDDGEE